MNKSGNENRSVRNTKKRLKEGLFKLLEEKPVNQITVRELTDLVDVNRGTFYFHYSDIYDMLHSVEDEMFGQLETVVNRDIVPGEDFPYLIDLFTFIKENSDITRIMLGKNTDLEFVIRLRKLFLERSNRYWKEKLGREEEREFELYSAFIVSGCVGVIHNWLRNGLKESPEEIARLAGTVICASLKPYFDGQTSEEMMNIPPRMKN